MNRWQTIETLISITQTSQEIQYSAVAFTSIRVLNKTIQR